MGKRKNESKVEKIKKKIRKLEKKLEREKPDNTSSEEGTPPPENRPNTEETNKTPEPQLNVTEEEELPEDFLLALGNEGVQNLETAEAIRPELAKRWANLMCEGLGKEAKEALLKKYPTPSNFPEAVAPVLNPEIQASLSETGVNRDKRIIHRQNLIGKLMSGLGKSLTKLLKGDINSKVLIEEINDAAKLAAEVFYRDTVSRKFFALAGTTKNIKEAIKDSKPDKFLFGGDCSEKIKLAQGIAKTSAQIKTPAQPKEAYNKKQGNWRSSLPQQTVRHRPRGGRRPQSYRPPAPVNQARRNPRQPPPPPPPSQSYRGRPQYRR